MKLKEVFFTDCFNNFIEEKTALGLSKQTLDTYKLHIKHFLEWAGGEYIYGAAFDIDFWNLYLSDLREDENKNDVTVASYARSVRAFLYWCMDNEYVENYNLKLPKYQKKIKETYTAEEIATLLKAPVKHCSEVEYQTWVFINLIMATGLRLTSALNLKVDNYVKKEQELYVQQTKQKQGQKMYLNSEICAILNKYIKTFDLENGDYIFCTADRSIMAKRTMQDNVATYNRARGVKKTSIHLMRHTFAKNYYQNSHDVYGLQHILGHSTITTTEHYLRGLDVTSNSAGVYNPQRQFVKQEEERKNKRRARKM